jgi:hypothetical protein
MSFNITILMFHIQRAYAYWRYSQLIMKVLQALLVKLMDDAETLSFLKTK